MEKGGEYIPNVGDDKLLQRYAKISHCDLLIFKYKIREDGFNQADCIEK